MKDILYRVRQSAMRAIERDAEEQDLSPEEWLKRLETGEHLTTLTGLNPLWLLKLCEEVEKGLEASEF